MKKKYSEVLQYKFTRELHHAIELLKRNMDERKSCVVQSEDLLLAMIDTFDTGVSNVLGQSSITPSKIKKEINESLHVESRSSWVDKETLESVRSFSRKDTIRQAVKNNPVQLIKEQDSGLLLNDMKHTLSENTKSALQLAEEMCMQLNPDGGIDSYWILIAFSQDADSNAFKILEKQMLLFDGYFDGENLHERFKPTRWGRFDYKDGYTAQKRMDQLHDKNRFTNKLEDPDYSILEDIATDLTAKAREGQLMPVIGRDDEIQQIEIALSRRDKNNAALIGDGGVGKSALADGLALKIINGEAPALAHMRILQFSLNDLGRVFGVHDSRGVLRFIEEMKREKDTILFIDEMHMLGNSKSLTDALKPVMARGDFRIIGATTPREWNRYIAGDSALVRRFEMIAVDEPSIDDSIHIVQSVIASYENFHQCQIDRELSEQAVHLAKKYLKHDKLPDSAFTLIDNACSICRINNGQISVLQQSYYEDLQRLRLQLQHVQAIPFNDEAVDAVRQQIAELQTSYNRQRSTIEQRKYELQLSIEELKQAVVLKARMDIEEIKLVNIKVSEIDRLKDLKTAMHDRIIGQTEAVNIVANAVIRAKTGFRDKKKPVGVFLFSGTTGVGKTETVKVLTEELCGSVDDLIRFDMSEYQQQHEVAKLIGSPPGYIGFGAGGQLTNSVKDNLEAVILFDEIEKAHPKVFDVLLQVFDDGRLTDSMGRTADFTKAIIVMTTNIGASDMMKEKVAGFNAVTNPYHDHSVVQQHVMKALKEAFRPEFLNRIDEVVTFKPFGKKEIYQITALLIEDTIAMIETAGYKASFDDSAVEWLAERCYDPENGARPIKRGITKYVEDKLTNALLSGEIEQGDYLTFVVVNDAIEVRGERMLDAG